jgi:hypothetical protein
VKTTRPPVHTEGREDVMVDVRQKGGACRRTGRRRQEQPNSPCGVRQEQPACLSKKCRIFRQIYAAAVKKDIAGGRKNVTRANKAG